MQPPTKNNALTWFAKWGGKNNHPKETWISLKWCFTGFTTVNHHETTIWDNMFTFFPSIFSNSKKVMKCTLVPNLPFHTYQALNQQKKLRMFFAHGWNIPESPYRSCTSLCESIGKVCLEPQRLYWKGCYGLGSRFLCVFGDGKNEIAACLRWYV